ncbi:MAG: aspartate/glutamate racemase family protein [Thermomicrobiales bacterium]
MADDGIDALRPLALLHTAAVNVATFAGLCAELIPGTPFFHMMDESLLKNTIADGAMSPRTARRVVGHIVSAEDAGAGAVLVTCSSIGRAVEIARGGVAIPVIRVDEAMADEAVRAGQTVGVIATLPTTLEPTAALVRARADLAGRSVRIVTHLCAGAFAALAAGDPARHDALIADGLRQLMLEVDVVVLAQATMARVADALPPADLPRPVPILASPRSGLLRAAEALRSGAA